MSEYWSDKYPKKEVFQDGDHILVQGSTNYYAEINSLVNNAYVLDTSLGGTAGCISYINKPNKIFHINLILKGSFDQAGISLGTIGDFAPPSTPRDIPFNYMSGAGAFEYGVVRIWTNGSVTMYGYGIGTMVNPVVHGECYIG